LGFGLSALLLGLFAKHVARAEHLRAQTEHDLDWAWRYHSLVVPAIVLVASTTTLFHPVWALALLAAESVGTLLLRLRAPSPELAP
jgi:hypothetical protein